MTLSPRTIRALDVAAFVFGIAACGLLVHEIGWDIDPAARLRNTIITGILAIGVLATEITRLTLLRTERRKWRSRVAFLAIPFLALLEILFSEYLQTAGQKGSLLRSSGLLLLSISQLTLAGDTLVRTIQIASEKHFRGVPPALLVVLTFVAAILAGTGLLMTPAATTSGIGFTDALFTSTSAVCVTGLITLDTATDFTFTGQAIILGLIQVGGLGVMTLAYFLALMSGQGISLRDRAVLGEILSETNIHLVGKVVGRIVAITFLAEAAGALLLHARWHESVADAWWVSLFHSVSAFCNAGFSTFSKGLMDPAAIQDRFAQCVIMVLIIIGGLGFVTAGQLPGLAYAPIRRRIRRRIGLRDDSRTRIPIHVRLVLVTTAILLVGGAIGFGFLDRASGTGSERFWTSVFNSVTARTAGFNVSDMATLSGPAVMLMCFLMLIGGSPGGTAGGIRTTTFALAMLELHRLLRGRTDVNYCGRRIPRDVLDRCHVTLVLSLLWIILSVVLVGAANPKMTLDDVLFECVSAFATVGLSRGITPELAGFSKIVLVLSMLIGRIGILTFAFTIAGVPKPRHYRFPEGRLPLN